MENQDPENNQPVDPTTHVVQSATKTALKPESVVAAVVEQKQPEKKEEKMPTKKRFDPLLLAFALLTILSLAVIGLIEWQRQQYTALQVERETLVTSLPGETKVTQKQIDALSEGLLTEEEVISFIEAVEKADNSFNEFELSFKSDIPEGNKAPYYLPVMLTLSGPFTNITSFINSLVESNYIVKVDTLEMTSEDGFDSSVKLVLTVRIYVSDEFVTKK